PLTPCSRTPFLAAVGKPFEGVVAVDGEVRVMQRVKIGFTFDHRYIDGFHGAKVLRRFAKVFENPKAHINVFGAE
ncbi:MAG: 2-oxo acid dehydrogenase subunit E2, partial [Kiritimatiellales bacterium]|nr:2-oxo acid dehydrogenase subunit E2 [Kiritimatiellales bacterium]